MFKDLRSEWAEVTSVRVGSDAGITAGKGKRFGFPRIFGLTGEPGSRGSDENQADELISQKDQRMDGV
jgi:hypothetical protein